MGDIVENKTVTGMEENLNISNEVTDETVVDYGDKIEKHRVELVQTINLERHYILTYLRSNNVLDEEDCQIILNSGTTRQQKNSKFLDLLVTRGEHAFTFFVQALEIEVPMLYELFTGKKVEQTPHDRIKSSDVWVEFDQEYLAKELAKTSEQYTSLTYMHGRLQKEKQLLKKQLLQVTGELNASVKKQEEMQFELSLKASSDLESFDQETMNNLLTHCQALAQENADKSNIIIALQARLLVLTEDKEQVHKLIEELQLKNKNLMQQVKDLTTSYAFERSNSIRLQEKYDRKNNELNKTDELRRELHLAKFNLSKQTEEKDALNKKLNEYRNVVTALNAKLALVTEQKEVEMSKWSEMSEEYLKIRQQAKVYEIERDQGKSTAEYYKEKVTQLQEDLLSNREQKEFLANQLELTVKDRDRAILEREEVIQYNNDLLKSRDEAVRYKIDISEKLEKRCNDLSDKLDESNKELQNLMLENVVCHNNTKDTQNKCKIFQEEMHNAKNSVKKVFLPLLSIETPRAPTLTDDKEEESLQDSQEIQDKSDISRTESVLDKAKAVLTGDRSPMEFSLNSRQLSWVYDSLKGKHSNFQAVLNNPLVFPQFDSSADEEIEKGLESRPITEKRRIGSNRGMKKRSNSKLDAVKAIIAPLSPTSNRRKSLAPA